MPTPINRTSLKKGLLDQYVKSTKNKSKQTLPGVGRPHNYTDVLSIKELSDSNKNNESTKRQIAEENRRVEPINEGTSIPIYNESNEQINIKDKSTWASNNGQIMPMGIRREIELIIQTGSIKCNTIEIPVVPPSDVIGYDASYIDIGFFGGGLNPLISMGSDSGSFVNIGFLFGSLITYPEIEAYSVNNIFFTGSLVNSVLITSGSDSMASSIGFYTGSTVYTVLTMSGSDSGSAIIGFYTGSLVDVILTTSGSDSGSTNLGFYTGSVVITTFPHSYAEVIPANLSFLTGSLVG